MYVCIRLAGIKARKKCVYRNSELGFKFSGVSPTCVPKSLTFG